MSTVAQAMESVYQSLDNDNLDIDMHIASLKNVLSEKGQTSVEVDPTRLPQANREGRKFLQAYFKKRGVTVTFPK